MPDTTTQADTILVRSKFPAMISRFKDRRILTPDDLPGLTDADRDRVAIIVQGGSTPLSGGEMDAYPNLALIVSVSAGYEGIDSQAAAARGVAIRTGVGVNAEAVAELALGLVICAVRGVINGDRQIRGGDWKGLNLRPVRALSGMKVGIVGLGHIGLATAARLQPFGCAVAWTGPRPKPQAALPYVPSLLDLATQSDVLIVTAHLDETTRHMIDRPVIEALGPQGLLVNVARGGLVDEDALIAALTDGRLGGAALDVFAQEPTPAERWRDVPNALLTPHLGGVTFEALDQVFDRAAEHVAAFLGER